MLGTILAYIIVGLIAGFLARALMPGDDRMSLAWTIVLGIGGALLAGFIGQWLNIYGPDNRMAGIIASTIGAIVLLAIERLVRNRRHHTLHPSS